MPCQLPYDCLNEIFEHLEKDKVTLYSCLLVNHLWCEASVRILWRHIDNNIKTEIILSTFIACLPDESKDLLHKNGIFISTPVSKPPLFNYASFCKVLSVDHFAEDFSESQKIFISKKLNRNEVNEDLIIQEIFKMLMNQTSLKKLIYKEWPRKINILNFTQFPGAKDCLTGLSKLSFSSIVHSEFCYQLSQICHNIQSISIEFYKTIPNGLKRLMGCLTTLIKLKIKFSSCYRRYDFNDLQYITFPQLQILKLRNGYAENFIKFLEINGKNLKELYANYCDDKSIHLAIAKFCPNLKSLYTTNFHDLALEELKIIFHSCEQLEKIRVMYSGYYYSKIFEIVAKHSPTNFHELELYSNELGSLSKELESFFINWKNRIPQKPLTLIVVKSLYSLDNHAENMKIIEKYKKFGTIKKFEVKDFTETLNFQKYDKHITDRWL